MSDRIRQLEDALAISQASNGSRDTHPLLSRELLSIKSGIELHSASQGAAGTSTSADASSDNAGSSTQANPAEETVLQTFGTLAVRDDGGALFYGSSAGQEVLLRFHMHTLRSEHYYRVCCLMQISNLTTSS